jgi:acetylcholinesterase
MEHSWYGCKLLLTNKKNKSFFFFSLQESGSPISMPDITAQQSLFDQLVADTGCTGSADLIACLRTVPLDTLMTTVNKDPTFLSFNSQDRWQPSVDGHLIVRNPLVSVQKGLYAKVLFVQLKKI